MRDLWRFLDKRPRYELYMLVPALLLVVAVIYAFYHDSHFEREYRPKIMYVKSWPLDRSIEEIRKQAAIDKVRIDKERAALEARQKKRQQEFQKVDNALESWGF